MDEAEFSVKMDVFCAYAEQWWNNLEQEERVEIYLKETRKERSEDECISTDIDVDDDSGIKRFDELEKDSQNKGKVKE